LNEDGSLVMHVDTDLVMYAHSAHITVTPFLSNHWNKAAGNAALDNPDALVRAIRDAVYAYSLDGVNVDIQNVNETYRDKYTQFVTALRENLFEPDAPITREQMAVLLDRLLVLSTGIGYHDNPFSDVSADDWSYTSIIKLYGNSIFSGYPDGTFLPKNNITRAEAARLLAGISGYGFVTDAPAVENESPVQPR